MITSALFVAIHLPGWLALHTFSGSAAATIFVFGFVMTRLWVEANSLGLEGVGARKTARALQRDG